MKLALCLFNYFPFGGLQRDFLRIARVCRDRGHEVHVYTMAWDGEPEPGLHIHLITVTGWQNYARIDAYIAQVKQRLAETPYDLVVGFNKMPGLDVYYAADVCYQARMQQRAWWHRIFPRYRYYAARERDVFAAGKSTAILLISPLQQPEFIRCYQTETERFHLLPPGIARDRIAPPNAGEIRQSVRERHAIKADDYLLLMVGSGFKTKGLDRSIRALAALPADLRQRTWLYVVGQDNEAPFRQLAKKLGVQDRLIFLGGRPDVPDYLLAADVLLHPAYHENTGTVLLEALAAGLPVLTVDHCGYAHYIVEADAGRVMPSPFDQSAFDETVKQALLSSDRIRWHANALTFARETDIYSLPEKAVEVIEVVALRKQRHLFDQMMALQGDVYRKQKGRLTQRVEIEGKHYFLKRQTELGWKEIFKNLLQLRYPVLSMRHEWEAIEKLQSLGIQTPHVIAKGERGANPAEMESFVLLEEIAPAISLEELCKRWQAHAPAIHFKRDLIARVAEISKKMHDGGINHRDYYLCHLLLKTDKQADKLDSDDIDLYVFDLHRAQIRKTVPQRWRIKDLAGLYFSSLEAGLTRRDYYRFITYYEAKPLRSLTAADWQLWKQVKKRGEQLYREHQS